MVTEDIEIINPEDSESVDPCYGMEVKELNAEHINALKDGKYLYTNINGYEYALIIRLRKKGETKDETDY